MTHLLPIPLPPRLCSSSSLWLLNIRFSLSPSLLLSLTLASSAQCCLSLINENPSRPFLISDDQFFISLSTNLSFIHFPQTPTACARPRLSHSHSHSHSHTHTHTKATTFNQRKNRQWLCHFFLAPSDIDRLSDFLPLPIHNNSLLQTQTHQGGSAACRR